MIICIPSMEMRGLASALSQHFGRAPYHYIVNTRTRHAERLVKPPSDHEHCMPVQALLEREVETVLCKGIGEGAVTRFAAAGIPVLRTSAATVGAAVDEFEHAQLAPVAKEDLCPSHDHAHPHHH